MPRFASSVTAAAVIACVLQVAAGRWAHAQPSGRVAYLIDFATQTLDLVDLVHGTASLGLLPVGDVPNQIEVRGGTAYVVNSLPENLQIIDLAGPATAATVSFDPGSNPWAVELVGPKAYVSLWGSDAVAVVDLDGGTVSGIIAVGVSPEGMCPAGGELYVANSGFVGPGQYDPGTVTVIDTATDQVVATIPVGLNPQWCAVDGEGEIAVVCSDRFGANGGRVFMLDPVAHAPVDSLWVGGFPGPIAISSGGVGWMVEYGAGLLAVDTVHHTVLHDVDHPVDAGGFGAIGLDLDAADRVHVALSADGLLTVVGPDGQLQGAFPVGPAPADVALYEAEPSSAAERGAPGAPGLAITAQPNPGRAPIRLAVTAEGGEGGEARGPVAAEVTVFDAAGRAVRQLHRGPLAPGAVMIEWDGLDAAGRPVPAGVYLARVATARGARAAKLTLVR